MELKESSHSLSELLGDDGPIPDSIGLTPQLVDDELPVLPSSSQGGGTIRTVGSSVITQSHQSSSGGVTGSSSSTATKSNSVRSSHTSVAASRTTHQGSSTSSSRGHQHGTGTATNSHSHSHSNSHSTVGVGMDMDSGVDFNMLSTPSAIGAQRKRSRRASNDNRCVHIHCLGCQFYFPLSIFKRYVC